MNKHIYLRAYMAGIVFPTIFLLVVTVIFCIARYVYNIPVPIERVIVFPMAVVPNLWGLWNILFIAIHGRRNLPIGLHGAILPFLLAPLGYMMTRILDFPVPHFVFGYLPVAFCIAVIAYYLVWKYLVNFVNGVMSIA